MGGKRVEKTIENIGKSDQFNKYHETQLNGILKYLKGNEGRFLYILFLVHIFCLKILNLVSLFLILCS